MHGATILVGSDATRARVSEAIEGSALVHYAGHADSDAAVVRRAAARVRGQRLRPSLRGRNRAARAARASAGHALRVRHVARRDHARGRDAESRPRVPRPRARAPSSARCGRSTTTSPLRCSSVSTNAFAPARYPPTRYAQRSSRCCSHPIRVCVIPRVGPRWKFSATFETDMRERFPWTRRQQSFNSSASCSFPRDPERSGRPRHRAADRAHRTPSTTRREHRQRRRRPQGGDHLPRTGPPPQRPRLEKDGNEKRTGSTSSSTASACSSSATARMPRRRSRSICRASTLPGSCQTVRGQAGLRSQFQSPYQGAAGVIDIPAGVLDACGRFARRLANVSTRVCCIRPQASWSSRRRSRESGRRRSPSTPMPWFMWRTSHRNSCTGSGGDRVVGEPHWDAYNEMLD